MTSRISAFVWLATCASGLIVAPAAAQTRAGGNLEEVVVTATRREARLQDVPIAVSAVSSEALRDSNFTSLSDVQYLVPALSYRFGAGGEASFQIRGVGTQSFDPGAEQSVGLVVDGVVSSLPRNPGLNSLVDVERIEVLRGPQGTLFGKNTSAGVMQVVTRRPVLGEWEADSEFSFGTDDESIARFTVNVPTGRSAAARLSASYEQRDGFVDNLYNDGQDNTEFYGREDFGLRGKFLWEPTEKLDVLLIGDYQDYYRTPAIGTIRSFGPGPANYAAQCQHAVQCFNPSAGFAVVPVRDQLEPFGIVPGPENERVAINTPGDTKVRTTGLSAELDYVLGSHTLTSISAFRRQEFVTNGNDVDSTPLPFYLVNLGHFDADQLTQELRLASASGQRIEYVIGAYYFNLQTDGDTAQYGTFGSPIPPPPGFVYSNRGGLVIYDVETESVAGFGEATWRATDNLRLILGARYTQDKVYSATSIEPQPGVMRTPPAVGTLPAAPVINEVDHGDWTGRAGLQYNFTPEIMAYTTVSRGYKGPTVNNVTAGGNIVDAETSIDYELGVKSSWLDNRLIVNAALFHADYEDFQAQVYDTSVFPAQYRLANADGLITKGVELDVQAKLSPSFDLSGSATYNETEFKDFLALCYRFQPISAVADSGCFERTPGSFVLQARGLPLNYAPEWSFNLATNYQRALGGAKTLRASANFSWRDDYYSVTGDPNTIVDAYGLVGLSLSIGSDDGRWRTGVFVRNALNQDFVPVIIPTYFDPGGYLNNPTVEARRTIGVNLSFSLR